MNQNTLTFNQGSAFQNVVCKMWAIFLQTSTCLWWISINGKTKVKTKWDDLYISEAASLMTSPHGKALFAMWWYSRHWQGQWTSYFNSFCPEFIWGSVELYFDGFVQDCRISSANALEILQACTKPLIFALSTISQHWNGTGDWIPSLQKMGACLSCIFSIMAADDLAMQGAMIASALVPGSPGHLSPWCSLWHIYASINRTIMGSDNGFLLVRRSARPLSEPMLDYCQFDLKEHISMKFHSKFKHFYSPKCIWMCRLRNGGHFVWASMC